MDEKYMISGAQQVAQLNMALTSLKTRVGEAANDAAVARNAIAALKGATDVPKAQMDASTALNTLSTSLSSELGSMLRQVSTVALSTAESVFYNFIGEDGAITTESLVKVTDHLPTNTLHQPRYLNLHDYCKAVHTATDATTLCRSVQASSFMYSAPEDLYVRTILTRTRIYLEQLTLQDEYGFFSSAIGAIGEMSLVLDREAIPDLQDITDTIQSNELQHAFIEVLRDPSREEVINQTIDDMLKAMDNIRGFISLLQSLIALYEDLSSCMAESSDTIDQAYRLYKEANGITF